MCAGAAVVRCLDGRVQQIANGKVEYEATCKGGPNAPSLMLGADKVRNRASCMDMRGD